MNIKIKTFDFPSFESWQSRGRKFTDSIGNYTCAIETFSFGCNGNNENTYQIAISTSSNPLNIHSNKIISYSFSCDCRDTEKLKKWYESITKKVNDEWQKFILKEYIL